MCPPPISTTFELHSKYILCIIKINIALCNSQNIFSTFTKWWHNGNKFAFKILEILKNILKSKEPW